MSVGANSIKRAAKATNAAAEPKEEAKLKDEAAPVKKTRTAKSPGKAAPKAGQKPVNEPAKKPEAKSGYEAYGIGQQLPVHLL